MKITNTDNKVIFDSLKRSKDKNINSISFTLEEQEVIYDMINSHIIWGEGGCLIKENGEVDNKKMKLAKKLLSKI